MKLGILAAGISPEELREVHGTYADMSARLFTQFGYDYTFEVFDVRDDQFPESIGGFDGWLITGSRSNVYENLPWMQRLKALILTIHETNTPLLGICFGHQIIAEAFGGKVEAYEGGWGLGVNQYRILPVAGLTDMPDTPSTLTLHAVHQDQVVEKPALAEVFASSSFCPNAGLLYGNTVLTVQAHPEFSSGFERDLLELKGGAGIPTDAAKQGLASLNSAPTNAELVVRWMVDVLNGNLLVNGK